MLHAGGDNIPRCCRGGALALHALAAHVALAIGRSHFDAVHAVGRLVYGSLGRFGVDGAHRSPSVGEPRRPSGAQKRRESGGSRLDAQNINWKPLRKTNSPSSLTRQPAWESYQAGERSVKFTPMSVVHFRSWPSRYQTRPVVSKVMVCSSP